MLKCSRITRYTRDLQLLGSKDVELFVGSARNLQLIYDYAIKGGIHGKYPL